jgi:hypothetical protein
MREAPNASYIGKWNPENLLPNMEIDSSLAKWEMRCDPSGTFEDARADLSCVAGQGAFAGSGLSHPSGVMKGATVLAGQPFSCFGRGGHP